MAQTKRKRQTKHRGNAAGVIESRGRTGRKPTKAEREGKREVTRVPRQDRPPTWKGAVYWPFGYYTDRWLYNRRMRKKASQQGKAPAR